MGWGIYTCGAYVQDINIWEAFIRWGVGGGYMGDKINEILQKIVRLSGLKLHAFGQNTDYPYNSVCYLNKGKRQAENFSATLP